MVSPTDELAIDKVPLESLHVENVQVKRVRLHTVQLAIGRADLRLSLIEVRLCARFAIKLLYLVALHIEKVAVISLLIRCGEATKDKDVLV